MDALARPGFGTTLRSYRRGAGRSQLQTAQSAGISQRHLSFLESGRARASRGVVLALGGTLGLALAQQNELLLAAGFAPLFQPDARDPEEIALVERALHAMLDAHEPYPALLLRDSAWIERGNRGAARLWSAVRGAPVPTVPRDNVFDLMLREGPGRVRLENWADAAACVVRRYMAEHAAIGAREFAHAAAALARNPEVRRLLRSDPAGPPPPVLHLNYRLPDARLSLFIIVASLQAPLDTRVERLRVELFIPADPATAEWFRAGA